MSPIERDSEFLRDWYQSIESQFELIRPNNGEFRHLCDRLENENKPIHSWYNLKEAFSSKFPQWTVRKLQTLHNFSPARVLDPFVGGGTSLISFARMGIETDGVEYNPFIAWAAEVKSSWDEFDPAEIDNTINLIDFDIPKGTRLKWPKVTTFHNSKYFRRSDVRILLYVDHQLGQLDTSEHTKDFLRLGIASAIDDVANLLKDGRALRYVKKSRRPTAEEALRQKWNQNLQQVMELQAELSEKKLSRTRIWRGSAINLQRLCQRNEPEAVELHDASFDLIFYSPPYLNNFDYSEIYKLELWLLGFIKDYHEWQKVRKGTLRSHHSIKFPVTNHLATEPKTKNIYDYLLRMSESPRLTGYAKQNMPPVILGYFDDMFLALKEQYRVLQPGGFIVYMVANSYHKNLPIATDLIIGEIARSIGFEPLELTIMRERNGRKRASQFLRESVVFLRKPK